MDMNSYIEMLKDSLLKKKEVLNQIKQQCELQKEAVRDGMDTEKFDAAIEEKRNLIDRLTLLDNGFESVYDRVRDELNADPGAHAEAVRSLQAMITEITELSGSIQAAEERNKKSIEKAFREERDRIKTAKKSLSLAASYYKSMSRVNYIDPQLMDTKK